MSSSIKPVRTVTRATTIRSVVDTSKTRDFERKDQYYSPGVSNVQYRSRKNEYRKILKWGQRKLTIGAIQFFNHYWDPVKHPNPKCVYVGAAPGLTIITLSKLFPQIEWHLYDTTPFPKGVRDIKNVHIYEAYFEDKDVETWKGEKSVFFISDIRNKEYDNTTGPDKKWTNEAIVINDMKKQEKWVYLINPVSALLKFRLPWIGDPNDKVNKGFYKTKFGIFPYISGHVLLQSWLGPTSTEGRLVPVRNSQGEYYSNPWDCVEYENFMYYHNNYARQDYNYKNPFGDGNVDGQELTGDWDSSNEVRIWRDYLIKMGLPDTQDNVVKLSRTLTNILNEHSTYKTLNSIRRTSTQHDSKVSTTVRIINKIDDNIKDDIEDVLSEEDVVSEISSSDSGEDSGEDTEEDIEEVEEIEEE